MSSTFSAGPPPSSVDRNVEELEAHRTVGLTRILPADTGNTDVPEALVRKSQNEAHAGVDVSDADLIESDDEEAGLTDEATFPPLSSSEGSDKEAVVALIQEGIARERAEELIAAHGTDWEILKAAAWPEKFLAADQERERKAVHREHHVEGIPPFETPGQET